MDINDLKKLNRFKDIATILTKYGFDDIVRRLDVPGADLLRKIHPRNEEMSTYERLRAAIEELGPTFIKFGQIMSLRPDLLSREILDELEKLQDDVQIVDYVEISAAIEEQLGRPIKEIFSIFDVDPIAAASLSQA